MLSFFPILMILIYHPPLFSFLLIINSLFLNVFIHNLLIVCSILISIYLIKIEIFAQVSLFFVVHVQYQIQGCLEDLLDGLEITEEVVMVIGHAHCLLFYLLIRLKCNFNHDVKVFQVNQFHLSLFYLLLFH